PPGANAGRILAPRVAPYQVVAVPYLRNEADEEKVRATIEDIGQRLEGRVRLHVDWSDHTPGWKFNEWELRGAPLRLEIGPRDVANDQAVVVRRDSRAKQAVPLTALEGRLPEILDEVQRGLFERAVAFRESRTFHVASVDELA